MKTKFLVVLLILSGLLVTAEETYACNDPPNADLDASPNPVCVGCSVTLDGSGSSDPDGEITKYEWDWTNDGEYDYEETPGDGIAYHTYDTAGTYTVKLRVTDDDDATDTDTCTVTVVKVVSVSADKDVACTNEEVEFKVTTYPPEHYECIMWSGGGSPDTQEGGEKFITKWGSAGTETVKASCADSFKEYEIEVIDGLTVIPRDAYVCSGKNKCFKAWRCDASSKAEDVTASAKWTSKRGEIDGGILEAPDSPSSDEGDDWVKAEYDGESDECELTVVQVPIDSLDRVPPSQSASVGITVSPTLTGASIGLDVDRTAGDEGSATVSPTSVQSTTTVTITGGEQTSAGDNAPYAGNLSLTATLDECDEECECDDESFTVCAHPTGFEATFCNAVLFWDYYGLEVQSYVWGSDSGATPDLNQCWLKESFSNDHCDRPPFYNCGVPGADAPVAMSTGSWDDRQGWKKSNVRNYTAGEAGWDQRLYFTCNRCGAEETLTTNTTTFEVYDNSGSGDWWISTSVSMSCPGPDGGCSVHENIIE